QFLAGDPRKASLLLNSVATKRESLYIGFISEDPTATKYSEPKLTKEEFEKMKDSKAVEKFLNENPAILSEGDAQRDQKPEQPEVETEKLKPTHVLKTLPGKMAFDQQVLKVK